MRKVVYDIEIFPNLFVCVFYEVDTKEYFIFQISKGIDESPLECINDKVQLMDFLNKLWQDDGLMIGYNVLRFDYPLIHELITIMNSNFNISPSKLVSKLWEKAKKLIDSGSARDKNLEIKNPIINQCDLYRIHHLDSPVKATSLKMLEFVLHMENVAELPYPPGTQLTRVQIDEVIYYCKNYDVKTTVEFYYISQQEIAMREKLSKIYNLSIENYNDPKIGEHILLKFIREKLGVDRIGKSSMGNGIVIKDIILSYIKFESEPFKAIYNWFCEKVITDTKKVFNDLEVSQVQSLVPFIYMEKDNMAKGRVKTLNVVNKDFRYDFGLGGIHGSIESGIYESKDGYTIADIDVKGFYPNESIVNRFCPRHIGEVFCDILEIIGQERDKYAKKTPENTGLKLAGNASYGKTNSEFSQLYDPHYTMTVTVNGQLLVCMLAEWLFTAIPDIVMIQANTDGITVRVRNIYQKEFYKICEDWEVLTKLILEHNWYKKMAIRDCNNYLAIDKGDKVKRKGVFGYKMEPGEREIHKNHSMLVVPKALEQYYVNGISVEDYMKTADAWDFLKRVKLIGNSKLIGREKDKPDNHYGKITRYYISEHGEDLIKVMPGLKPKKGKTEIVPREFHIESGYNCTVANRVTSETLKEIKSRVYHQYYIDECYKIINVIDKHEKIEVGEEN